MPITAIRVERGLFKYDIIDYHAILGLPIGAKVDVARKQFLRITRILYPDIRKIADPEEQRLADALLSKLVNPAYENLCKGKERRQEHILILNQMRARLAAEGGSLAVESDAAKELMVARGPLEQAYFKLMRPITAELYERMHQVPDRIATISELNLVYMTRKPAHLNAASSRTPQNLDSGIGINGNKQAAVATESQANKRRASSPMEPCRRRAQGYLETKNYVLAIRELREALEVDKHDSSCHALLGIAYLGQKSFGMARVHIRKAIASDPNNPQAKVAQQMIDQLVDRQKQTIQQPLPPSSTNVDTDSKGSKRSFLGGLFGNGK
ncbi:hypothetical protein KR51_00032760 [Rubidibacter lacunae KORDI 51-2]|uniref:Uncharacterized protein n=1 Tax=Rubidibacter lacunae KORDI 51-2 TaxID=582515 RepID=U5DGC2_9CHRO|nr:hypothetical protein [Rubidibacter lacunae]ERN40327.1 hypothetical protein KR51_00032760 [Rubidibacter lacunae KORDI 51-2]